MASPTEKTEEKKPASVPEAAAGDGGAQANRPRQVDVDESQAVSSYANFCRVTGTPEEVIVDVGLNAQPFGTPNEPVKINQRLVMNYYTAKRLLHALSLTVQRHEAAFGVLETDVQKRVLPSMRQQTRS